jgi:hypothetical protein
VEVAAVLVEAGRVAIAVAQPPYHPVQLILLRLVLVEQEPQTQQGEERQDQILFLGRLLHLAVAVAVVLVIRFKMAWMVALAVAAGPALLCHIHRELLDLAQ